MGTGRVGRVLQKRERNILCKGEGVRQKMVHMTVRGRAGCRQKEVRKSRRSR